MSADSFSLFPFTSWVEYRYLMKPFFYSEVIYLHSRNDIDIGRIHIKKEKHLIKRGIIQTPYYHELYFVFNRGKSLVLTLNSTRQTSMLLD